MPSEEFQPLQGMSDISGPEIETWQELEALARCVFDLYGYTEVRTPLLEKSTVFERSLGDTTDVVQKEMYAFEDRGGRRVALRPEGTAGVIRYVAGLGGDAQDLRLWYAGPMFRSERPQAGRKRQFHQIGTEAIGPPNAALDAETIALQVQLLKTWGLSGFSVSINTRGLPEDRKTMHEALESRLQPHVAELGEEDQRRMKANIFRVLDSKDEKTRAVVASLPPLTEFMSDASRKYLQDVLEMLRLLDIDVKVSPTLIRGLDYYVHTVWEITHPALGAQDALAGGGRYRISMGNKTVEGVGFAMGIERVITALQKDRAEAAANRRPAGVWIVSMGSAAFQENFKLAQTLRLRGIRCGLDLAGKSMKAQMRAADRSGASKVIIRGDAEMEKGMFLLKDMAEGTQEELEMPELMDRLRTEADQ